MAIDVFTEQIISMTKCAKIAPNRPHVATPYRWAQRRSNALETIWIGGRCYTSVEALKRFIQGCNQSAPTPGPAASGRAGRDLRAVDDHLRAEGIL